MRVSQSEQGAALILSMLLLLVLTLLASSAMQSSILQQRMVAGMATGMTSIEIAESGLRDAERWLDGVSDLSVFDGTNGLYRPSDTPPSPLEHDWVNGTNVQNASSIGGATPKYFVQYLGYFTRTGSINGIAIEGYGHSTAPVSAQAFRIVVWAAGANGESHRLLESYYMRDI